VVSCCTPLAQLKVAEAVEGGTVRVVRRVSVDSVSRNFDDDPRWDVLAIGEGDSLKDTAPEGC
jgi:hypothetical protein